MFDIGGLEFLLIALIGIIIVGPKDLPGAIRGVTVWVRKARGLARDFQGGLDDLVREADLDDVKKELGGDFDSISIENQIKDTVDPTGEIGDTFDGDWYSDHAEYGVPDDDDDSETDEVVGIAADDGDTAAEDERADETGSGSKA